MTEFAIPLSLRVICHVLGVPVGDYARFRAWSSTFLSASSASVQARMEAYGAFIDYLAALVAAHRDHPGDDLVDLLIEAHDEHERLSESELVNLLFVLLVAGHETTATMISRGVA